MIFSSGLSGHRMGMRDPEIDCEGCLLGLWGLMGIGVECGNNKAIFRTICHTIISYMTVLSCFQGTNKR